MTIRNTPSLRRILLADAAAGLGAGLVVMLGAGFLAPLLGLPAGLLFWAGVALMPIVAVLAAMAMRDTFPRLLLVDIAALNALWATASLGLLVSGAVAPNALGVAFVVAQALLVGGFAILQFGHLRQSEAAA